MKKTIISLSVCSAIATSSFAIGQGTSSYNQYESGDLQRTGISTSVSSGSKVGMTKSIGPRGNEMKGMPGLAAGLAYDYLQKTVISEATKSIGGALATWAGAEEGASATESAGAAGGITCSGYTCYGSDMATVQGKTAADILKSAAKKVKDEVIETAKLMVDSKNTAFGVEAGIVGDLNKLKEKTMDEIIKKTGADPQKARDIIESCFGDIKLPGFNFDFGLGLEGKFCGLDAAQAIGMNKRDLQFSNAVGTVNEDVGKSGKDIPYGKEKLTRENTKKIVEGIALETPEPTNFNMKNATNTYNSVAKGINDNPNETPSYSSFNDIEKKYYDERKYKSTKLVELTTANVAKNVKRSLVNEPSGVLGGVSGTEPAITELKKIDHNEYFDRKNAQVAELVSKTGVNPEYYAIYMKNDPKSENLTLPYLLYIPTFNKGDLQKNGKKSPEMYPQLGLNLYGINSVNYEKAFKDYMEQTKNISEAIATQRNDNITNKPGDYQAFEKVLNKLLDIKGLTAQTASLLAFYQNTVAGAVAVRPYDLVEGEKDKSAPTEMTTSELAYANMTFSRGIAMQVMLGNQILSENLNMINENLISTNAAIESMTLTLNKSIEENTLAIEKLNLIMGEMLKRMK